MMSAHHVAAHDRFLLRMVFEPTFSVVEKLFNFILSDPVVLLFVEHRDHDVEMAEQMLQAYSSSKHNCVVETFAPFWEMLVECVLLRENLVTERLEESAEKGLATYAGHHRNSRLQRDRLFSKFRAASAASAESASEYA